jgi:hypothetical protein
MEILLEAVFSMVRSQAGTLEGPTKSPKAAREQITQDEEYKKVPRRKQCNPEEETQISKKPAVPAKTSAALNTPLKEVVTRNFFAPLEQQKWTPTPPVSRPCHMRRQFWHNRQTAPNSANIRN